MARNEFLPSGPKTRVAICNIAQNEFFVSRTYGHYHILPAPAHLPYQLTFVEDAKDRLDQGEENYFWIPIMSADIAKDLVETEKLDVHGVFVCAGVKPTNAELEKAKNKMETYYRAMIDQADAQWARLPRHENIDDNARRAAMYYGEDRPWAYRVVKKIACPGCGEQILATIARHTCGYIVDVDKALAGGLIGEDQAKKLRGLRTAYEKKVAAKDKEPTAPPISAIADEPPDPVEVARAAAE